MGGFRVKRGFKSPYTYVSRPTCNGSPWTGASKIAGKCLRKEGGEVTEKEMRSNMHHCCQICQVHPSDSQFPPKPPCSILPLPHCCLTCAGGWLLICQWIGNASVLCGSTSKRATSGTLHVLSVAILQQWKCLPLLQGVLYLSPIFHS